jgi:DNA primase catalytic subunit
VPRSITTLCVAVEVVDEIAELYEQYYRLSTTRPFDQAECELAYFTWKAAMERLLDMVTK